MSKEQNEVLEQQRYLLERRMYRLDPAPPKMPAQEYIVRYLTEKEEKYLAWYLHDQEPALNKLAQAACERYAMAEHFADIKQAAVCGILVALQKYDPAVGAEAPSRRRSLLPCRDTSPSQSGREESYTSRRADGLRRKSEGLMFPCRRCQRQPRAESR